MVDLIESLRRKPGARGTAVMLADGHLWMLANPIYRIDATGNSLTDPPVDHLIDQIFECSILNANLPIAGLQDAARSLLKVNYELTDAEIFPLIEVSPGAESHAFAMGVLAALLGTEHDEKTYTAWVRASLIANGLAQTPIPASDLANVLAILVATDRTIPLTAFADACRLADTMSKLEALI